MTVKRYHVLNAEDELESPRGHYVRYKDHEPYERLAEAVRQWGVHEDPDSVEYKIFKVLYEQRKELQDEIRTMPREMDSSRSSSEW